LLIVFSYFEELWLRWVDSADSLMFYGELSLELSYFLFSLGLVFCVVRCSFCSLELHLTKQVGKMRGEVCKKLQIFLKRPRIARLRQGYGVAGTDFADESAKGEERA
jgi:hypothetical protein